jgi:hypothetical protein
MFGLTPTDLKLELERLGYRNYLVDSHRLVPVKAADFQPWICVDYLAVKRWPAGLADRRNDVPLSDREMMDAVVETCRTGHAVARAYMARSLQHAPRWIRLDARIKEAIASLRTDPDEAVRVAASWETRSRFPWFAAWKRGATRAG